MVRFAVCDDEQSIAGYLENLILDLHPNYQQKFDITVFLSGEEFCDAISSGQYFDIVLMDIKMSGITGIEAGKRLRDSIQNGLTLLLFVSSYKQYYESVLDLETFCFIHKPVDRAIFNRKVKAAVDKILWIKQSPKGPLFTFKQGKSEVSLTTNEIVYFESRNRLILLHTEDDSYEYYGNLNTELKKLPKIKFARIHQSYIINFDFLRAITTKQVTMSDGNTLIISTQYRQNARVAYIQYRGSAIWT